MNTNFTSRPRLACRLARLRAALGSGAVPASGHAAGCPDCQRYFAAAATLEDALHREAARAAAPAPAGLERGILRAVAEARLASSRRPERPAALGWLAGAAFAAAAAVAVVFTLREPAPAGTVAAAPVSAPAAPGATVVPAPLALPTAEALALQNPLQSELDQVYSDARYALRFLAMNFLPGPAAVSSASAGSDKG